MATNNENNSSVDETSGQEPKDQQNGTTDETSGNGSTTQVSIDDSTELPETHPLVKTLSANKTKLASQNAEIAELRAKSTKVTQLETELSERPTKEAVETLQTRYDRLEEFLQQAGGPLGKALDSRTFTRELFETDKSVADIVKDWNKANPTATAAALASAAAAPGNGKANPNDLLRAAIKS